MFQISLFKKLRFISQYTS